MRGTLAAIALLGFSGAASAAPADDSETERATLLRIISEGTARLRQRLLVASRNTTSTARLPPSPT